MTILFDACRPVKSSRRFGAGILASRPTYHAPYTAADLEWLVEDYARREHLDRLIDNAFAESETIRRLEEGLCL